ncbi:glycosyl hydrolase [Intrasporangium mesophilum]
MFRLHRAYGKGGALLATSIAAALALAAAPSAASLAAPAGPTPTVASSGAQPALTPATFADPPASVRPIYRWWMPLAYTQDDVLRDQLRDLAAAGAGGVEVAPFVVPGEGNQSNAFLAQYGWGTPAWAHKMEVITAEAADLGLVVDQNLGPQYPPTVPSLNSFNQPEAEQQIIFGRELRQPGETRSGALPAPSTAPPSVTTQLCEPAAAGQTELHVRNLGGFAPGDTITVGSGPSSEQVTVTSLGDRTAACGVLTVFLLTKAHPINETVADVARTTRIRTLVAQCANACPVTGTAQRLLDPNSVLDVTAQVNNGALTYTFPAGNGNPWVLIDFLQAPSGSIAQRGGYMATQPNYVVDHLSRGGVTIQTHFWDKYILTDAVRANLRRIGSGAVFEDSLELGSSQKWTWNFLDTFKDKRGYDLTLMLPALAGAGNQGTSAPAFELAGIGPRVREDYRQTMSDLYSNEYVAPMQAWAAGHGLNFRVQSYGTPIATAVAASRAGIPEGESLNFGSPNPLGAEQDYRVVSAGAHLSSKNLVSVECCAVFQGGYRSSLAGPNVPGGFGQGGDGSAVGGRYSQGLLDSIYKSYAGGVNQLVWHGLAYRDAPKGVGTSGRDGGTWPGYEPWDIFGALNVNDAFGPRQASWADYKSVNDSLARTQLVLRQGQAKLDLGVYYEDLGLIGQSVSAQQSPQHMLGTDSATSSAGYTYEYVSPDLLGDPSLKPDKNGGLFGDSSGYKALVLNNQRTISLGGAQQLLRLAKAGLRVFVVGNAPMSTTGAEPDTDQLAPVISALLAQPAVTQVATEAALPDALDRESIRPAVSPQTPTPALGLVRRDAGNVTYDFIYNRSGSEVTQNFTLSGSGRPYAYDTWTGKITPIGEFVKGASTVTVPVRIAPHDMVIIALTNQGAIVGSDGVPIHSPATYAVSSDGQILASGQPQGLVLRASSDGRYETQLSNGTSRVTQVQGVSAPLPLNAWTLDAQTWTPGENEYTTVKTDLPVFPVVAGSDGRLPSWREITAPQNLTRNSGIGTYSTTFQLPTGWSPADGAYLNLGDVLDSVTATVNGQEATVDQSDRGRIDLGHSLRPGQNALTIRVATTMFNAVRSTGDSNYQSPDWQQTGLIGPVVLTPYRDTDIARDGK